MRINRKLFEQSQTRGTTLVEALVAMAVLGIVIVSVFAGISFGFSTIGSTRAELRANQILVEKMETIRLYSWEQINTPGFIPATFTASYFPPGIGNTNATGSGPIYNGKVTVSPGPSGRTYSSEVRKVTVALSWTTGDRTINRNISTLVSRGGLQRYIY